jgi:hypothetical protein
MGNGKNEETRFVIKSHRRKYQVSSFSFSCSDMIFKYLWIRWINKIELKMILYFFCSSPLNFFTCSLSLSWARWNTYFIRAIFLCTQKLNFRHTYALVSLQRKKDNAEYSMNALSERARNLFVNRRKALFPLFHGISCSKKLTRRSGKGTEKQSKLTYTDCMLRKVTWKCFLLCGIFERKRKFKVNVLGVLNNERDFSNGWSVFAASLSVWSGDYAEICEAFRERGIVYGVFRVDVMHSNGFCRSGSMEIVCNLFFMKANESPWARSSKESTWKTSKIQLKLLHVVPLPSIWFQITYNR